MDRTDPIERVREARRLISREHPDIRSLIDHYEELQARHAERLVSGPEPDRAPAERANAADRPSADR